MRIPISPSLLEKLELCPCFTYSENSNSEARDRGILLHKALETDNPDLADSDEDYELVESVLSRVRREAEAAPTADFPQGDLVADAREEELNIPNVGRGLADRVFWYTPVPGAELPAHRTRRPLLAHVIDYKTGTGPLEPAEINIQMQCYALGLFAKKSNLLLVKTTLMQPETGFVDSAVYSRRTIPVIKDRIKTIAQRWFDPFKEPTPTPAACARCGNKIRCPAFSTSVCETSHRLGLLPHPSEFNPVQLVKETDRSLAQTLGALLTDWAEQVKAHNLRAVLDHAIEIPGYVLVRSSTGVKVNDALGLVRAVSRTYDIPEELMLRKAKLSLKDVIDVLHENTDSAATSTAVKKLLREELLEKYAELFLTEGSEYHFLRRTKEALTLLNGGNTHEQEPNGTTDG